jgi:Amidase
MKAVTDCKPWEEEPGLVPLPWKKTVPAKSFTVGVLWDDGIARPHPPIQQALKTAVYKMKAAAIKMVDWEPYKHVHFAFSYRDRVLLLPLLQPRMLRPVRVRRRMLSDL